MKKLFKILFALTIPVCYSIAPADTIIIEKRGDPAVERVWQQLILDTVTDTTIQDKRRLERALRYRDVDVHRDRYYRPYQSEALRYWRRELLNPW